LHYFILKWSPRFEIQVFVKVAFADECFVIKLLLRGGIVLDLTNFANVRPLRPSMALKV